jgi:hypothetical protein
MTLDEIQEILEDRLAQLDVVAEDLPQTPAETSTSEEGFLPSSE